MNKLTKNNGFTIVELIVVMAIIAILTLIAIPTLTGYITKARTTAETGTANSIYKSTVAAVADLEANGKNTFTLADKAEITKDTDEDFYNAILDGVNGNETIKIYANSQAGGAKVADDAAWNVFIPITADKDAFVDPTADIYIIAPSTGNMYNNGSPYTAPAASAE